jgi:hypothetical protein
MMVTDTVQVWAEGASSTSLLPSFPDVDTGKF